MRAIGRVLNRSAAISRVNPPLAGAVEQQLALAPPVGHAVLCRHADGTGALPALDGRDVQPALPCHRVNVHGAAVQEGPEHGALAALVLFLLSLSNRAGRHACQSEFDALYPKNVETWDETALFSQTPDAWMRGLNETSQKLYRIVGSPQNDD